jgi:hypothetical protein
VTTTAPVFLAQRAHSVARLVTVKGSRLLSAVTTRTLALDAKSALSKGNSVTAGDLTGPSFDRHNFRWLSRRRRRGLDTISRHQPRLQHKQRKRASEEEENSEIDLRKVVSVLNSS